MVQIDLFRWICSYLVHYVYFGPNFPICSYSVYIGPLCSFQFTLVQFGPPCFHLVHFYLFGPFVFTLVHFYSLWSIFLYLHIGKRYIWVESIYSKSKFINIYIYIYICMYINLKLVISKILSIIFIVAIFLLSHINVAFQSTSVWLNLSKSFCKL